MISILPTENLSPLRSVVTGDGPFNEGVAVLDSEKCRDMRHCVNCGGPQQFVEVYEVPGVGRVGFCFGCGEERVILFTRVSE